MSEASRVSTDTRPTAAEQSRPPRWLALAPIAFLLLWSGGYTGVKAALPYIAPINMLAVRYAIVVSLLGVAFLILRPPLPRSAAEWRHLAMTGLLIQGLYFLCMNLAMWMGVPAGVLAIILSPQPILVALVVPRLAGEAVPGRVWAGLMLGLTGAIIVVAARTELSATSVTGLLTGIAGLIAITAEVRARRLGPEEELRAMVGQFMREYEHSQAQHVVLVQDVKFLGDEARGTIVAKQRAVVDAFARTIAAMKPRWTRRALRVPLAMILFGMINWTFTWLRTAGPLTYDDMARVVTDIFLHGVLGAAAAEATQ